MPQQFSYTVGKKDTGIVSCLLHIINNRHLESKQSQQAIFARKVGMSADSLVETVVRTRRDQLVQAADQAKSQVVDGFAHLGGMVRMQGIAKLGQGRIEVLRWQVISAQQFGYAIPPLGGQAKD